MGIFSQHKKLTDAISCDLVQDIATFPHKHDTVIGSKGISLSTGQKQRIALARAVYAKKAFMILDDVFSGLDANTRQNIFARLLGPDGALRRWETTVLIASHSSEFLDFIGVAQLTIAQLTS
jgi:ABC-type multidrug transport system fused ATPase/permease subunit